MSKWQEYKLWREANNPLMSPEDDPNLQRLGQKMAARRNPLLSDEPSAAQLSLGQRMAGGLQQKVANLNDADLFTQAELAQILGGPQGIQQALKQNLIQMRKHPSGKIQVIKMNRGSFDIGAGYGDTN